MVARSNMEDGKTYTVILKLRARVIESHNSHGQCFLLEVEKRDYNRAREIWVDANEIILESEGD